MFLLIFYQFAVLACLLLTLPIYSAFDQLVAGQTPAGNPFGTQAFGGAPAPNMGMQAPGFGGMPFGAPGMQVILIY